MAVPKSFYSRGKWTGLVLSVVLLGAYVASYLHGFSWGSSWYGFTKIANGQVGFYRETWITYAGERRAAGVRDDLKMMPVWEISLGWCFLGTAIATAWFWYQARSRIEVGHCACCGYDLTGNISGICPECGTSARIADSHAAQNEPPTA